MEGLSFGLKLEPLCTNKRKGYVVARQQELHIEQYKAALRPSLHKIFYALKGFWQTPKTLRPFTALGLLEPFGPKLPLESGRWASGGAALVQLPSGMIRSGHAAPWASSEIL